MYIYNAQRLLQPICIFHIYLMWNALVWNDGYSFGLCADIVLVICTFNSILKTWSSQIKSLKPRLVYKL